MNKNFPRLYEAGPLDEQELIATHERIQERAAQYLAEDAAHRLEALTSHKHLDTTERAAAERRMTASDVPLGHFPPHFLEVLAEVLLHGTADIPAYMDSDPTRPSHADDWVEISHEPEANSYAFRNQIADIRLALALIDEETGRDQVLHNAIETCIAELGLYFKKAQAIPRPLALQLTQENWEHIRIQEGLEQDIATTAEHWFRNLTELAEKALSDQGVDQRFIQHMRTARNAHAGTIRNHLEHSDSQLESELVTVLTHYPQLRTLFRNLLEGWPETQ